MRLRKRIILLFVLINSVLYAYGNECKVNQDSVQAVFSELLKLYGNGDYYEAIDYVNKQQNIIDNLDNKLFNYTNTEYEQYDSMTKNMKNKIFSKKYKSICNVLNSNINKNKIMNANK